MTHRHVYRVVKFVISVLRNMLNDGNELLQLLSLMPSFITESLIVHIR